MIETYHKQIQIGIVLSFRYCNPLTRINCRWIMTYCLSTKCKKKLRTGDSVKRQIQEEKKKQDKNSFYCATGCDVHATELPQ